MKVNYNLSHLFKALLVYECYTENYKDRLIQLLRAYLNEENLLLMPSGRAGLYYLLKAIPIRRVLIPAYTCKAVAEAAIFAGKEVACIEVEADGFNMSLEALEAALTIPSIVIATHQFGIPCQIEKLTELCNARDAFLIEDTAASLGTRVQNRLTGTFGDAAFYSFDSTKLINVPLKGGFISIKDSQLFNQVAQKYRAETVGMPLIHKLKLIAAAAILVCLENHRLYGLFHMLYFQAKNKFTDDSPELQSEPDHYYNYDLANWQAYIAVQQVLNIEKLIQARQYFYSYYRQALAKTNAFVLPPDDVGKEWACIRFPLRICGDKLTYYERGIELGIDFAFSFTFIPCSNRFRHAVCLANSVLDLPFYYKLSANELSVVVSALKKIDRAIADNSST